MASYAPQIEEKKQRNHLLICDHPKAPHMPLCEMKIQERGHIHVTEEIQFKINYYKLQ